MMSNSSTNGIPKVATPVNLRTSRVNSVGHPGVTFAGQLENVSNCR